MCEQISTRNGQARICKEMVNCTRVRQEGLCKGVSTQWSRRGAVIWGKLGKRCTLGSRSNLNRVSCWEKRLIVGVVVMVS